MQFPSTPDRLIKDGFPANWYVVDRPDANEALLCRKSEMAIGGSVCICTRPRATATEQWLPVARILAQGFETENKRLRSIRT